MRTVLKGAAHIAGARLIRIGASVVFQVGAARILGPSGYGLLTHAISGAALSHQATDFGVGPSVSVGLAGARGSGRGFGTQGRRLLRLGLGVRLVLTVGLVVFVMVLPGRAGALFGTDLVVWGVVLAVAVGWAAFAEHVVVGLGWTRLLVVVSTLAFVLPTAVALVVVALGGGPGRAVAALALSTLVGLLLSAGIIAGHWRREASAEAPDDGQEASRFSFARTAFYLGVVTLGGVIVFRAPVVAMGSSGDAVATGLLGAGVAVVERGGVLGTALGLSAGPSLTGWLGGGRKMAQAFRVVRAGSEAAIWVAAGLLAFGPLAIRVVLGQGYLGIIELLPWLVLAVFLQANMQSLGALLDYGGWARQRAVALGLGAGTVLVALWMYDGGSALLGAALLPCGLAVAFLSILASALRGDEGRRVRGVLMVVAVDLGRLGLLVTVASWARGLLPSLPVVFDALAVAMLAGGLIWLTRWKSPRRRTA